MAQNEWPQRLYALDVTRGIASLAVVMFHWKHFGYIDNILSSEYAKESQPFYNIFKLFYEKGSLGVGYFFLLSGFIFFWLYQESIRNKTIGGWSFFVQRFSRLYPLHIATLLTVVFLQFLFFKKTDGTFVYQHFDVYHFVLNVFYASEWDLIQGFSYNGPVWSVSVEVLLYAMFFGLVFLRKNGIITLLLISLVGVLAFFKTQHSVFKGMSLFFLGGAVFQATKIISTKYSKLCPVVYIVTALGWLSVFVCFYVYDFSGSLIEGRLGNLVMSAYANNFLFPLTICSLSLLEINRRLSVKNISWVGDITYSSYLLHFPLQLLFALLVAYGVLSDNYYYSNAFFVIFFVILVGLAYATFRYFEMPAQKMLRKRLKDVF